MLPAARVRPQAGQAGIDGGSCWVDPKAKGKVWAVDLWVASPLWGLGEMLSVFCCFRPSVGGPRVGVKPRPVERDRGERDNPASRGSEPRGRQVREILLVEDESNMRFLLRVETLVAAASAWLAA
jgi:hypothetical protein